MHAAAHSQSIDSMMTTAGWQVRLPLVAPSERAAVLRGWASHCSGKTPRMRCVPFGAVRQLSPGDFVSALAHDLRAAGVVVGLNYRFGFKASRFAGSVWLRNKHLLLKKAWWVGARSCSCVVSLASAIPNQAAGTADTLKELGSRNGMRVRVMDLLGDASNADGNVSSSEASLT